VTTFNGNPRPRETEGYSITDAPHLDEATIMVSLGEGATYETFATMLAFLTQTNTSLPYAAGWNVALNGEDVNVVKIDEDTGMYVRPPLNDKWQTFGPTKCVRWENINTLVIF
jgi:CTP-dependent riboflavin kinase